MSENTMPEQDEVALNAVPNPGTIEPEAGTIEQKPAGLEGVDNEQLAKIREKIAQFRQRNEKTISGSEAPDDGPVVPENVGPTSDGAAVDWSEYDLEFSVRHLYPKAQLRNTAQGPKWIAMVDEFQSVERAFGNEGKRLQDGTALNLGEYLNESVNTPEQWRIMSVLPSSMGRAGVLLYRQVPLALPDPQPLKKETEVAAPGDPELQQVEDAAMKFAAEIGQTPPPVEEPVVEVPEQAEKPISLETLALALNPPTERDRGPLGSTLPAEESTIAVDAGTEAAQAIMGPDFGMNPLGAEEGTER